MNRLRIGIRLESLSLPLRRGLQAIERLGVTGVQVDAVGDLSPRNLSQTGRREFCHALCVHNLELTALGCPLRHGLDTAAAQEARIEHVRQVLSLSFDLGLCGVIVAAGRIPEDATDLRASLLTEALLALDTTGIGAAPCWLWRRGWRSGQVLAGAFLGPPRHGRPGRQPRSGQPAAGWLRSLRTPGLRRARVVHSHAQDARQAGTNRPGQLVPLGHGDIEWMQYLSVLEEIEYRGWLVIKQEAGDRRLADVAAGVGFLRRFHWTRTRQSGSP